MSNSTGSKEIPQQPFERNPILRHYISFLSVHPPCPSVGDWSAFLQELSRLCLIEEDKPKGMRLDLDAFSHTNRERAAEGFKTYKNVPITYWTTALAGEVGELCNMIKKMERVAHGGIDGGSTHTAASLKKSDLEEEVGGIFIYLDLLSGLLDINLTNAVIETFNSKSEKYKFSQFIKSPESTDNLSALRSENERLKVENADYINALEQWQQFDARVHGALSAASRHIYAKGILDKYKPTT